MSTLTDLQNSLVEHKEDKVLANILRDIKLTPGWKAIIDEGFIQNLGGKVITQLASATTKEKEQYLAVLTGISALQQYLEEVTTKGVLASANIEETEAAITTLLGEQHG